MIDILVKNKINHPLKINNVGAILFDLDGTLIHTLDLHVKSFQYILKKLGRDIDRKELEVLMGLTPQDIIKKYFANLTNEQIWKAALEKENYLSNIVTRIDVFPGVKDFLGELKIRGIKSIVISSTHRTLVKILLEKSGILDLIDDIVSGDEIIHGKPNPEPFDRGSIKSKINKENIIAIGDSIYDARSAIAAKIKFIAVLTGKTPYKVFKTENISYIISSINDLQILN